MGIKKMILILFLAFYFSCGYYQAKKIFPSDNKEVVVAKQLNNNHNVDGHTTISINNKYGHAAESHVGGGRGSGGDINGDGSRSPGSSNFIPIYAANAHHNRKRGAASSHKSHNVYLALFAIMFFAYF